MCGSHSVSDHVKVNVCGVGRGPLSVRRVKNLVLGKNMKKWSFCVILCIWEQMYDSTLIFFIRITFFGKESDAYFVKPSNGESWFLKVMLRVLYQLFRRGNSLYYRDFQLKFIRIIVIIESMMLILAYDSYFEKKRLSSDSCHKCPKRLSATKNHDHHKTISVRNFFHKNHGS